MSSRVCEVCGGNKHVRRFGTDGMILCNKHYMQMYSRGKILDKTNRERNEIIEYEDYAEIVLLDRHGNEKGRTLISKDKIDLIKPYKWSLNGKGYVHGVGEKSHVVMLHRLIMNAPNENMVDHINHNPLDNRNENLRLCDRSENQMNKRRRKNTASGITGVHQRESGRWRARINLHGETIYLGTYDLKEEAVNARKEAEIKYFGEFSYKEENDVALNNSI